MLSEDCDVEAVEPVTVPAGTYEAYRVECTGSWTRTGDSTYGSVSGRMQETFWYAPAVNRLVKSVSTD